IFILFLGGGFLYPQSGPRYPLSAILDEAAYSRLPRKAPLASRAYDGLPKAYSLKQYAPLPGDQTDYGTCVAWASAYAARTISESVTLSRKDQSDIMQNVFSPVYVYRTIRPDDPECQEGAAIYWALDLMKDSGAVRMIEIERTVDFPRVDLSYYSGSKKFPIADYVTLFSREERSKPGLVTRTVKKSLAEGKPVIIGMNTPYSFMAADNVWQPEESPDYFYGGHAMCVVGYDDEKSGGAFEILNSWGGKWGNGGFMWIPYNAFVDFVMEGYEMIENLAVYSDTVKFSGFARVEILERSGSRPAPLVFMPGGSYKTAEPLGEGTEFRFVAGAGESAYMYAFAATQEAATSAGAGEFYSPVLLFPPAGVSPLLNYDGSAVTLPGEDRTLVLDNVPGMEYLFLLYAKQALDIQAVMRRFENAKGTPAERLASAAGARLLNPGAAGYDEANAAFAVETGDSRAVAALIVAIDHR
ncbi:MAG: C1 family peptidase, partial [Treponema sp.]|nr:C1 family peptidase [Treponema sp.]